jgi:serine/threonine protein kinase
MLTAAGSTVGTVAYMSPEQARGLEVDGRTDIWALGVMLCKMVTGSRPFQGATQASIFDAIMNRAPAAPSLLNPGVPPALEHIILKPMEKDRALRYQHASDLLADLEKSTARRNQCDRARAGARHPAASYKACAPLARFSHGLQ